MNRLFTIVISGLLSCVYGFHWGVSQCIAPMHGVKKAAGSEGVTIYTHRGKLHVESGTPIKGFLLSGSDIIFSNPPQDTELTDVCGGAGHGISHSNSKNRNHIIVEYVCSEGKREADLSAYIVFTQSAPYVALEGRLGCPERPALVATTSAAPISTEQTTSP